MSTFPAREARLRAGFNAETAAKRLRIGVPYLWQMERHGFTFIQAERAARLFNAPLSAFLPPSTGSGSRKRVGKRGRQTPSSPRAKAITA